MANNQRVLNPPVAIQFPDVEATRTRINEYDSIMEELEKYLQSRSFLEEDEYVLKASLKDAIQLRHTFETEYQSESFDGRRLKMHSEKLLPLLEEIQFKLTVIKSTIRAMQREKTLEVCGNLLACSIDLHELVPDVLTDMNTTGNNVDISVVLKSLQTKLETWSRITGMMHLYITNSIFKLPDDFEENLVFITPLFHRFRTLHSPRWFFDFVEAVAKGILQNMGRFEQILFGYHEDLGNLKTDVEQATGYH